MKVFVYFEDITFKAWFNVYVLIRVPCQHNKNKKREKVGCDRMKCYLTTCRPAQAAMDNDISTQALVW